MAKLGSNLPHSLIGCRRLHHDAAMRDGNAAADAEARRRARQRRRGRWLRAAVWPLVALAAVIALALGGLFAALQTESGTRYAWDAAVELLGGRLSGTLEGGALATGLRLSHLRWHDATTDIQIDHVEGQWRLQRAPLKFIVDFLHAETVDVRLAASTTPSTRTTLPEDLRLPLALEIADVRVGKILIHDGTSTTELSRLALHGRSDGRHHELGLDRLTTPFGDVNVALALDGVRPFTLKGDAGFAGKVADLNIPQLLLSFIPQNPFADLARRVVDQGTDQRDALPRVRTQRVEGHQRAGADLRGVRVGRY